MSDRLNAAIAERDQFLVDLDIDCAKDFLIRHGSAGTRARIDWLKVLHLARLEASSVSETLRTDSRVCLAQHGAQSVATLPHTSPYLLMAMDLLFPPDCWADIMKNMENQP